MDFENTRISLSSSPQSRPDRPNTPSEIELKIRSVLQSYLQRYHYSPLTFSEIPANFQDSAMNVLDPLIPWVNLASDFKREDVLLISSTFSNELSKILNSLEKVNSSTEDSPVDKFITECFCNLKSLADQHKANISTPPEYCPENEMRKNVSSVPVKECYNSKNLAQQYDFFKRHKVKTTSDCPLNALSIGNGSSR